MDIDGVVEEDAEFPAKTIALNDLADELNTEDWVTTSALRVARDLIDHGWWEW